jgi:WhiB family transcriptional regulator, redox-sensing transcriptional regulator
VEWVHQARCKDEDPELFFPVGITGASLLQTTMAKGVCNVCQVRKECLEWALVTGQESGVWGGLSEEERRALRRTRRRDLPIAVPG